MGECGDEDVNSTLEDRRGGFHRVDDTRRGVVGLARLLCLSLGVAALVIPHSRPWITDADRQAVNQLLSTGFGGIKNQVFQRDTRRHANSRKDLDVGGHCPPDATLDRSKKTATLSILKRVRPLAM